MNRLASICAGLLFLLSNSVFAEDHLIAAQQHVNTAVVHGEAGHTQILIEHAKAALEHTLAASLVAKGVSKNHLDLAAKELQQSIDLANLGHVGAATIHAESAEKHIKASNK